MTTLPLRQRLVDIARKDVGKKEVEGSNRGPAMAKFWPSTISPELYTDRKAAPYYGRPPYCAAAVSYWVQTWINTAGVACSLGLTLSQADKWRCKSPGAYAWQDWAKNKGLLIMNDSQNNVLHTGDIVVYDFSHIGIVSDDFDTHIRVIEANTGMSSGNDGDGIEEKIRARSLAKCFIRLLP